MCMIAVIDGQSLDNQGKLAAAVGADNVVRCDGYAPTAFRDECCLCPIDLKATARKIGRVPHAEPSAMAVHFDKAARGPDNRETEYEGVQVVMPKDDARGAAPAGRKGTR